MSTVRQKPIRSVLVPNKREIRCHERHACILNSHVCSCVHRTQDIMHRYRCTALSFRFSNCSFKLLHHFFVCDTGKSMRKTDSQLFEIRTLKKFCKSAYDSHLAAVNCKHAMEVLCLLFALIRSPKEH